MDDQKGVSDLELPLCGHDLGVGAADPDAGVQAGAVVSLHDVSPVHLVIVIITIIFIINTIIIIIVILTLSAPTPQ